MNTGNNASAHRVHTCQQQKLSELLSNVNHAVIHTCESLQSALRSPCFASRAHFLFLQGSVSRMYLLSSSCIYFVQFSRFDLRVTSQQDNSFRRTDAMGKVSHHLLQHRSVFDLQSSAASVAAQSSTVWANMRRATQRMVSIWAEAFLNPPASCIAPLVLHDDLAELLWVLD